MSLQLTALSLWPSIQQRQSSCRLAPTLSNASVETQRNSAISSLLIVVKAPIRCLVEPAMHSGLAAACDARAAARQITSHQQSASQAGSRTLPSCLRNRILEAQQKHPWSFFCKSRYILIRLFVAAPLRMPWPDLRAMRESLALRSLGAGWNAILKRRAQALC